MKALMKKSRLIEIAAGIAATVVVLGCGSDDSGLQSRYKVSGTVTYKGQPVPKGSIVFEPTNPPMPAGRVANGSIANGSYSLTTSIENDGALPGEYKVIILASDLDIAQLSKGQLLHQGDAEHEKALKAAKNPLPQKYAQSDKTPLKAKVEAKSNNIPFDLED